MPTAREIITLARELIEQEGWCQGVYRRPNPAGVIVGRCLSGALSDAARKLGCYETAFTGSNVPTPPYYEARRIVQEQTIIPLSIWNDKRGRAKSEVLAVLSI
jgi:hypothetical protein